MSDIPPEQARDFLWAFLDRNQEKDWGYKTEIHMTRDEALMIWAADRWLETYLTWGVGIEETEPSIRKIRDYMRGLIGELSLQKGAEEMVITITAKGRKILALAAGHLDRYVIQRAQPERANRGGKRK